VMSKELLSLLSLRFAGLLEVGREGGTEVPLLQGLSSTMLWLTFRLFSVKIRETGVLMHEMTADLGRRLTLGVILWEKRRRGLATAWLAWGLGRGLFGVGVQLPSL
jgi:hypothetical protein